MKTIDKNPFASIMKKHSTEELIDIVTTNRCDYRSEAISAAEKELKKRNISWNYVHQQHNNLQENEQEMPQISVTPHRIDLWTILEGTYIILITISIIKLLIKYIKFL